jgi:hypothetical protein
MPCASAFRLRIFRQFILGIVSFTLFFGAPHLRAQAEQVFAGQIIECTCSAADARTEAAGSGAASTRCTEPCAAAANARFLLLDPKNNVSFQFDKDDLPRMYPRRNVYVIGKLKPGTRVIEVNNVIPDVPPKLKGARTISIVCDACPRAMAKTRPAAFKRLSAWGRYTILPEPKDAELVLLISANPYLGDYVTRDGPDKRIVQIETVYANVVDPHTGESLWGDRERVGSWFVASAAEDLVDELREIVEADASPVERKALMARNHIFKIGPNLSK